MPGEAAEEQLGPQIGVVVRIVWIAIEEAEEALQLVVRRLDHIAPRSSWHEVIRERNVAGERHPILLDHVGDLLPALERRWRLDRDGGMIGALKFEREPGLRVLEPALRRQR